MRSCFIFERGSFERSDIFHAGGRLKVATVYSGGPKVAAICKREKKKKSPENNKPYQQFIVRDQYSQSN